MSKSNRRNLLWALVAVIIAVVVIAGVGYTYWFGPGVSQTKELTFGFILPHLYNPYFIPFIDGIQKAQQEINALGSVKLTVDILSAEEDPIKQSDQIESFISRKYNAGIVSSVDKAAIAPACRNLKDAGIPLIMTDRDIQDTSLRIYFVGSDNYQMGQMEANSLLEGLAAKNIPKPWKVVILIGVAGTTVNELRYNGAKNVLDPLVASGDVTIVSEQIANFRRDEALDKTQAVLAAKTIDGLLALNDEMALGALQAVKGKGLVPNKDVIIVGLDATSDAVTAIDAGELYSSTGQSPYLQGYWPVWGAFYKVMHNWEPTEDWVKTPSLVVTTANSATYLDVLQQAQPFPNAPK